MTPRTYPRFRTDEFDDRRPEIVSAAPGPEESAAKNQNLVLLRRALERLPADKREILVLSRFQNMKYDEIASILDCEVGTVKVRVFRAMRALEAAYNALADEPRAANGNCGATGMERGKGTI